MGLKPNNRSSRLRLILAVAFIVSSFLLVGSGSIASASGCASSPSSAASLWGGVSGNWSVIDGSNGTGFHFQSSTDAYVHAPGVGTLTVDDGQYLWSTSKTTRSIWINNGTVWCGDKRGADNNRPLTGIVRSKTMAVKKYQAGALANWKRLAGKQSEGWVFHSATATRLWVFHGHVDTPSGTVSAGHWTAPVTDATGWYRN